MRHFIYKNYKILLTIPMLLLQSACTKSCNKEPATAASISQSTVTITAFTGIDTSSLSDAQLIEFTKIANDEVCPCDCPKSFAACLQSESKCTPAKLLGQWAVDKMAEGASARTLAERLTIEINKGFLAKPKTIAVAGYHEKGSKNPEIEIVEFADFECGHCKFVSEVLDELVKKYPDTVKLVYKHYPLPTHRMARLAALATEAAGKQGKFWEMHHAIFQNQSQLSEEQIMGHARTIMGDKLAQYQSDVKSDSINEKVENSLQEATSLKLEGTPSLFFNGRPYHLSFDLSGLELRIKMEQARKTASCE